MLLFFLYDFCFVLVGWLVGSLVGSLVRSFVRSFFDGWGGGGVEVKYE